MMCLASTLDSFALLQGFDLAGARSDSHLGQVVPRAWQHYNNKKEPEQIKTLALDIVIKNKTKKRITFPQNQPVNFIMAKCGRASSFFSCSSWLLLWLRETADSPEGKLKCTNENGTLSASCPLF